MLKSPITQPAPNYECPFCTVVEGKEKKSVQTKQQDIIFQDEYVTAFVSSATWPNNAGNLIVIPNKHHQDITDIPYDIYLRVYNVVHQLARVMLEVYQCEGVSTRQHNGEHGGQDVWHFHTHILPRWKGDRLYLRSEERQPQSEAARLEFANLIKEALEKSPIISQLDYLFVHSNPSTP